MHVSCTHGGMCIYIYIYAHMYIYIYIHVQVTLRLLMCMGTSRCLSMYTHSNTSIIHAHVYNIHVCSLGNTSPLYVYFSLSLIISLSHHMPICPSLTHPTPPSLTGGDHVERVFQQAGEGRETNTVEICHDLGGFLHGVHVLLARKTLDTNAIDEEAPGQRTTSTTRSTNEWGCTGGVACPPASAAYKQRKF
jgi:hypothetical protein